MNEISNKTLGDARRLLVELAKVLAPLAENSPSLPPVYIKLFVPPKQNIPFQHDAKILPQLHAARQKVSEWIDVLGQKAPVEAAQVILPSKERETTLDRPIDWKRAVVTNQSFRAPYSVPTTENRLPQAIAKPAQVAIDQVRGAIQILATSTHLQQPKADPIRKVLEEKIRPVIDQLIQAVEAHQETDFGSNEEKTPLAQTHTLQPKRDEVLFKKEGRGEPQRIIQGRQRERTEKEPIVAKRKEAFSREETKTSVSRPDSRLEKVEKGSGATLLSAPSQTRPAQAQPPSFERVILPGAPYQPTFTPSNTPRKKKKKLFSWERDEENDSLRDSP